MCVGWLRNDALLAGSVQKNRKAPSTRRLTLTTAQTGHITVTLLGQLPTHASPTERLTRFSKCVNLSAPFE